MPRMHGCVGHRLRLRLLNRIPMLSVHARPLRGPMGELTGQLFSLAFSSLFLLAVFPFVCLFMNLVVGVSSPNPVFFGRREGKRGKGVFGYCGFHSVGIGTLSSSLRTAGGSPHGAGFNGFLQGDGLSRLPRFVGMFGKRVSVMNPEPRVLGRARRCSRLVGGCVVHRLIGPKVAK